MPIDTSIYRTQQPVQIQTPNPLDMITAAARLEDVRAQADQRRLAGEAARQKAMDEAQVRSVMAGVGGDVDAGIAKLYSVNPRAAASLEEQVGKARKEHVEALKTNLANQNTQLDHYLKVWGLVSDQPSLDAIRPMFAKTFPELDKVLPTEYGDGTAVQRVSDLALSRKEQLEQKQNVVKLFADGKMNEAISQGLSQTNSPEEWNTFKTGMKAMGAPDAMLATYGDFSPENKARAAQLGITPAKREELAGQAATRAQQAARDAAAAHSPAYKEWQDYQATGGPLDFNAYMDMDANRKAAHLRVTTGQGSADDIKDAVQCMIDGKCPPQLPGRASTAYMATLAEANRRGYNLAGAATDWTATQKHIATMNGAQQLRLNQSVNALPDMLDKVDALATQWKGSGAPLLNRANLALAKNGVYGQKAATVATQLESQIADVVADLGNVYMGGNSPTDHALQLAGKSLQADWSEPVLRQMITLAKQNVQIRRNSINNTGVAGASEGNPYMPAPPAVPPPPAAGGGVTYQEYLKSKGKR